jgi:hypothetical protein
MRVSKYDPRIFKATSGLLNVQCIILAISRLAYYHMLYTRTEQR